MSSDRYTQKSNAPPAAASVVANPDNIYTWVCDACISNKTKGLVGGSIQYSPVRGVCESCQGDSMLAPAIRPEHAS